MRLHRALLSAMVAAILAAGSLLAQSAPDPRQVIGLPEGPPLQGAELETRAAKVSSVLRCPVCQGLSVLDSPTAMAVNMKHQVHEMVAMGYSQEQILTYFEKSYGEFVRLEPAFRGLNWLVWLGPLMLAIGGGYGVWRFLKNSSRRASEEITVGDDGNGRDALPDDPELAPWVLRARELAYGWPGGISPQKRAVDGGGD